MNTTNDEPQLQTAGELARTLERSTYGVKKALKRHKIEPAAVLGGTSYYEPTVALRTLREEMRSPNQKVLS